MVSPLIGIDANAHYSHTILLKPTLHLDERGHFLDAGRTPTRPKVEHYHLSPELAKRDFVVRILHREVGSVLADAGRAGATIASSQGGE